MKQSGSNNKSIPTLRMIAEKAGVSRETVSHILSGRQASRYRKSTQAKVQQIAEDLKYRPHRAAQAMKSGKSNLVAIVHFGAGIEAAHKSNLALSGKVNEAGYDYLAIDMNWYGGSVERTLAEILRARAEGVIISHIQAMFSEGHIAELLEAGVPIISVNGEERNGVSMFCDDVYTAFKKLTRHLMGVGHKRLLQLVAEHDIVHGTGVRTLQERARGFRDAFETKGVWAECHEADFDSAWAAMKSEKTPCGLAVKQPYSQYEKLEKPVYRFCRRLFRSGTLPDAIVCTNDLYAMEMIAAALECGIRIPEDIALTGYDNDRIGEFPSFGITTAEQNTELLCQEAVAELRRRIGGGGEPPVRHSFDSRIIIRTSCGATSDVLKARS